MVYHPRYNKARWKGLSDWVGPMSNFINHARAFGLDLPHSPWDALKEECPSYHIKGLCNARCGEAGDHHPYHAGGDWELL